MSEPYFNKFLFGKYEEGCLSADNYLYNRKHKKYEMVWKRALKDYEKGLKRKIS
jgi:hypothetical protein